MLGLAKDPKRGGGGVQILLRMASRILTEGQCMTRDTLRWILVIDQDSHVRTNLTRHLEQKGYGVITAEQGEQALTLLEDGEKIPSAIVMDIELPGITGYELLDHFRTRTNVPIIFLSSRKNANKIVEALEKGADDFVVKRMAWKRCVPELRPCSVVRDLWEVSLWWSGL